MARKLDAMKATLAEYEAAEAAYETASKRVAEQGYGNAEDRRLYDVFNRKKQDMGRNATDYLRTLIAVAEAAAGLAKAVAHDKFTEPVYRPNEILALVEAVKKITPLD